MSKYGVYRKLNVRIWIKVDFASRTSMGMFEKIKKKTKNYSQISIRLTKYSMGVEKSKTIPVVGVQKDVAL